MDLLSRDDFDEDLWNAIEHSAFLWCLGYEQSGKAAYKGVRIHDVMHALRTGDFHVVYVKGYVLVFNVGSPWYAPERLILEEMTVFRVGDKPADFRVVPQTLLHLARVLNCHGVVVGTSFTNDPRLRRVYERYGFKVEAEALIRII